jgi:hypothetical protein
MLNGAVFVYSLRCVLLSAMETRLTINPQSQPVNIGLRDLCIWPFVSGNLTVSVWPGMFRFV